MRCGSIYALNCLQFECTIRWGGDEYGQVVNQKSRRSSHKSMSRYDLECAIDGVSNIVGSQKKRHFSYKYIFGVVLGVFH